ncbi:hypothetical protein ARMGADRAFT_1078397 [Armillaria gallica]|uniref:RING-type domain-containing protein n=1 Tax=Armillaria gallica TaxID=47427 RepID=A0A2H3DP88_ARMGA|nr:hypothetical protein ARMGADRAFT_1078397 [Armillaria gallica]
MANVNASATLEALISDPALEANVTVDVAAAFEELQQDNRRLAVRVEEFQRELELYRWRETVGDLLLRRLERRVPAALQCPHCHTWMWDPCMLECGHTVCRQCCQTWFRQIDAAFRVEHGCRPRRGPVALPPLFFTLASRRKAELWKISALFHLLVQPPGVPRPRYTCPTCEQELHSVPIENRALRATTEAWQTSRGVPTRVRPDSGRDSGRSRPPPPWPYSLRYLSHHTQS